MSWRRIFTSEEARIESKAGACPPNWRPEDGDPAQLDWPFPRVDAAGDEDQETPTDA